MSQFGCNRMRIIQFLAANARLAVMLVSLPLASGFVCGTADAEQAPTNGSSRDELDWRGKRIVFLGDSNTYAGGYIRWLEEQFWGQDVASPPELLNLGLPSETCSGLSEPEHPFPRPNVHERVDRVLSKLRPQIVVVCYGMNDGIYYPWNEVRFASYQEGIRSLVKKIDGAGAKVVLMTPPAFDPQPMRKSGKLLPESAEKFAWFAIYENYDQVMQRYANWVMTLGDDVELVVDLHTPIRDYLAKQRTSNPDFAMSDDGVHVDATGHALVAQSLWHAWGMDREVEIPSAARSLIEQHHNLLRDAWLTQTGHTRPGMTAGLPLAEAQRQCETLRQQLDQIKDKDEDKDTDQQKNGCSGTSAR